MEILQPAAKIYLDDAHGLLETDRFRRKQLFSSGSLRLDNRPAFGALHTWDEYALAGAVTLPFTTTGSALLVPVVGPLLYRSGNVSTMMLPGQLLLVSGEYTVTNPFSEPETLTSFLHIGWNDPSPATETRCIDMKLATGLSPETVDLGSARFTIGKMSGRQVHSYRLADRSERCFVYALQGVFEVEGRLLHPGDGLALWSATEVESEALSEEAILLMLEVLPQNN